MIKFLGCGLENVFLLDGFKSMDFGGQTAYSYPDIEGLYFALGRSIALSRHPINGREFRFLRNALGWSQAEAGATLGKTNQAVAKWEKGQLSVPRSDGHVIRLAWLRRFESQSIVSMVNAMFGDHPAQYAGAYHFSRSQGVWALVDHDWPLSEPALAFAGGVIESSPLGGGEDVVYEIDSHNEYVWEYMQ